MNSKPPNDPQPTWPYVIGGIVFALLAAGLVAAVFIGYFRAPTTPPALPPMPGAPAWKENLEPGDRIESIDGQPVEFKDISDVVIRNSNAPIDLEIGRDGQGETIRIQPATP